MIQTIKRRKAQPLYIQVIAQIQEKISLGEWESGDKIPAENELAELLGVSRATLREAVSYLINKGTLQRRRGIGTFVGETSEIQGGLETLISVTQWISQHGYQAGTRHISISKRPPTKREQNVFNDLNLDAVGEIRRIRTADGKPVLYCIDIIPEAFMPKSVEEMGESLFTYLEHTFGQVVTMARSTIEVALPSEEISQQMDSPHGTPLLRLGQIHFNQDRIPVLLSQDHFVTDRFKFEVVRHRI